MLQTRTAAYDLQSLLPMNGLYDHEHQLRQADVDMANDRVAHIKRTRGCGNICRKPKRWLPNSATSVRRRTAPTKSTRSGRKTN